MTNLRNWPSLDTVDIQQVREYLENHHWQQTSYHDRRLQAFISQGGDEEPLFVLLPVDSELTDYDTRLAQAIDTIAAAEQQPTFLVLQRFVRNEQSPPVTMTADVVVIVQSHVLLIQRRHQPYQGMWALPGGRLNKGETVEACALRELAEEADVHSEEIGTSETAFFHLVGVYSAPDRDPRGRYISVAYRIVLSDFPPGVAAGDDAAEAQWFSLDNLPPLAFDHGTIITDACIE